MVSPEKLERVLRDFNFTYGAHVAGVVTRTGVPIAIQANVAVEADHFATMAATLVGSLDVLSRGVGLSPAEEITVETREGVILVERVGPNSIFVSLAPRDSELASKRQEALDNLRRVLEPLKPLEKFVA